MQGHIPPSQAAVSPPALSARHYVDSSSRSSNLGSSGEDLSVCPGAQVLIHLYNTKKKMLFVSLRAGNLSSCLTKPPPTVARKPVCRRATQ